MKPLINTTASNYNDLLEAIELSDTLFGPIDLDDRSPVYRAKLRAFTERLVKEIKEED